MTRLDLCKCAYLLSSCNLGSNALNHGHGTVKKPRLAKTPRLWALKRLSGPSTISIPTWCVPHIFSITLCFLSSESISISSISCLGYPGHISVTSWAWICYIVPVGHVWPQHKPGLKEATSCYKGWSSSNGFAGFGGDASRACQRK